MQNGMPDISSCSLFVRKHTGIVVYLYNY